MSYRPHGRATVNPSAPRAFARCDRCGFIYNHADLRFQFDYRGPRLTNLRFLVCETCYDKPQPQLKPILLTQDPTPIINARPENYLYAETGNRTTSGQYLTPASLSGDGTTVTIYFNIDSSVAAVNVGSFIVVSNMIPETYNGTYVVTGATSSPNWTISFASHATQPMEQAGTVTINVDHTTGLPLPMGDNRVTDDGSNRIVQPVGIPTGLNADAVMPLFQVTPYDVQLPVVSVTSIGTNIISVTCATAHGLSTGAQIAVENLSDNKAVGFYNATVTSAVAFTYPVNEPIIAGSLILPETRITTALVGIPPGMDQIPQTGT
jgi:hypothetical protein